MTETKIIFTNANIADKTDEEIEALKRKRGRLTAEKEAAWEESIRRKKSRETPDERISEIEAAERYEVLFVVKFLMASLDEEDPLFDIKFQAFNAIIKKFE